SPIRPPIVGILWHSSAGVDISAEYTIRIVRVLRIGIRALQLESAVETPVDTDLQRIIVRTALRSDHELELSEVGVSARRAGSEVLASVPDFGRQGIISVVAVQLVIGMGARVSQRNRRLRRDLLLDAQTVAYLGRIFHFVLQRVTDDLAQRRSREDAGVQSGKNSCGPEN